MEKEKMLLLIKKQFNNLLTSEEEAKSLEDWLNQPGNTKIYTAEWRKLKKIKETIKGINDNANNELSSK